MKTLFLLIVLLPSYAFTQTLPTGLCDTLKDEREKYPKNVESLCKPAANPDCPIGKLLNDVAFKHGMQVSRKSSGNRTVSPVGHIAGDVLGFSSSKDYWDVLRDWEKTAVLNCRDGSQPKGKITSSSRPWVNPVNTNPPPPPCNCDVEKLRIAQLEKEIIRLNGLLADSAKQLNICNTDLKKCLEVPPTCPTYHCEPAKFLWFEFQCALVQD